MNEWLTIIEIERQTGIPNETIRRYIRKYKHHMQVKKSGKSYTVSSSVVPLLVHIRDWYNQGLDSDQIEERLASRGAPVTIDVNDDERVTVSVSDAFTTLQKSMNDTMNELKQAFMHSHEELHREITKTREENHHLHNLIEKVLTEQEQKNKEQNEKLMEAMQLMQEIRSLQEQSAALEQTEESQKEVKRRPWWKFRQ